MLKALTIAMIVAGSATGVQAETVLTAASSFPEGHLFSQPFEQFVEDVNANGSGDLQIEYVGGAPAIGSPFQLGQRLQRGQFDLITITGPYYETTVPVSLALALMSEPMAEVRQTDWFAAMQEAHKARGLYYLGKVLGGANYHLYLREPLESTDLSGLRLRVAPHYQPFFGALGATTVRSGLDEIYTLMENGSIDGFGWPLIGFLPDWMDVTPYRVEPGFYDVDMHIVFNLESWEALTDAQQAMFEEQVIEFEAGIIDKSLELAEDARERMAEAGMQITELEGDARTEFMEAAMQTAWDTVVARDPEIGARLRTAADNM